MNSPDPVSISRGLAPNGAAGTGGAAAALVVVIVWAVQSCCHVTIPDYVQNALIGLGGYLGVWLHPSGRVPKAPAP